MEYMVHGSNIWLWCKKLRFKTYAPKYVQANIEDLAFVDMRRVLSSMDGNWHPMTNYVHLISTGPTSGRTFASLFHLETYSIQNTDGVL